MRNSQVGDLLVASTLVDGTVLGRSVCLLVHEDEDNAIGLLLNRPMQAVQVHTGPAEESHDHEVAESETFLASGSVEEEEVELKNSFTQANRLQSDPSEPEQPVIMVVGPEGDPGAGQILSGQSLHFGGPLSGPIVAVHGTAELGEAQAGEGVFVAAQRDHLEALLRKEKASPYRLIVGHVGWKQPQLNAEINAGVWHRIPATSDILATDDGLLWPALIRRATSGSLSRWLGTEHVADAHRLN